MTRIKKNSFIWIILSITFTIFMYICTLVNNQLSFFSAYQEYYSNKAATIDVNNLAINPGSFYGKIMEVVPRTDIFMLVMPEYNDATSTTIIFPERFVEDLPMLEGSFYAKGDDLNSVVIGKDVYSTLSNSEKNNNTVNIYGTTFQIQGILAESPFNNHILLNGESALSFPRIFDNIVGIESYSSSFENATSNIAKLLAQSQNSSTYIGSISEPELGIGTNSFGEIFQQYTAIFIQLFLVAILSIGIHFYQRFDAWKFELGIRKMVGANTIQLVSDTFKKFFILTSSSFITAAFTVGCCRFFFSSYFPFSLHSVFMGIIQVFILYGLLLAILFIFSIFYVRKVSVADIILGADE